MRFDPFGYDKLRVSPPTAIPDDARSEIQFGAPLPVEMYSGKSYLTRGVTLSSRIEDQNTPFETVLQRFKDTARTLKAINAAPDNLPLPIGQQLHKEWRDLQEKMHTIVANGPPTGQHISDEQFQELLQRMAPNPQTPPEQASLSNLPKEKQASTIGRAIGALLSGDDNWAQYILEPVAAEQSQRDKDQQYALAAQEAGAKRAQLEYQFLVNKLQVSNQAEMDKWKAKIGATETEMKFLIQAQEAIERADERTRGVMESVFKQPSPDLRAAALAVAVSRGEISKEDAEALRPALLRETPNEEYLRSSVQHQKALQQHRSDRLTLDKDVFKARQAQWAAEFDFKKAEAIRDQNNKVTGFVLDGKRLSIQEALANASIAKTMSETDLNKWAKEKFGEAESNDILTTIYNGALDEVAIYQREIEALRTTLAGLLPNDTATREQILKQIKLAEEQLASSKAIVENARKALAESQGQYAPVRPSGVQAAPPGAPAWEQQMRGPIGSPPKK